MQKIIRNTIILTIITLISGLLLGLAYEVTKDPIAQAEENAKKEAWQAVFPDADLNAFEQTDVDADVADQVIADLGVAATIDEVCAVDGGETGYVITATDSEGYGGDIQVVVGITADGDRERYLLPLHQRDGRPWNERPERVLLRTVCGQADRAVLCVKRRRQWRAG